MTTFFRLLKDTNKGAALESAVTAHRAGQPDEKRTFTVDPHEFSKVPNTPFAYWVDDEIRDLFVKLPPFESEGRTVKQGLATADDFRFVRAWWEVDPGRRLDPGLAGAPSWCDELHRFQDWCRTRTREGKYWVPFAKGGEYSPYYSDIHLVVNWKDDGRELSEFGGSVIRNPGYYFRPGVTWPSRPHRRGGFSAVHAGSIFSHTGTMIFSPFDQFLWLLAILNSDVYISLLHLLMPRGTGDTGQTLKYEVGYVKAVPLPSSENHTRDRELEQVRGTLDRTRVASAATNEVSPVLSFSTVPDTDIRPDVEALEKWSEQRFGISADTLAPLLEGLPLSSDLIHAEQPDKPRLLTSRLLGFVFGRWNLRHELDTTSQATLPDPFAPLPVVPPATLVAPDGLPATSGNIVSEEWLRARPDAISLPEPDTVKQPTIPDSEYPIPIPWDGILVDDETSDADIVARMRRLLQVIHGDQAETVEHELCEELGVQALRDYMASPNGFFADHLKRYSKSRRKAPIYWPLSTESGGYTVWVYYPRLTASTLFTILDRYVHPRRDVVEKDYQELASVPAAQRTRAQQKAFDRAARDREELAAFEEELRRVADLPYRPDHDDGVPICAAPLYRLFRHRQWSDYLKGIWQDLKAGKYDWAHLAYEIWPDRVREKAREDRSIAIAHDLEEEA